MNKESIFERYLLFFYPLFFFIDIMSISLFEQPFVQAVLTLYIFSALRHKPRWFLYIVPLVLLALEAFFLYARFDVSFLYTIPVTLCIIQIQHIFDLHTFFYLLFLAGCLCLKFLVIEASILKTDIHLPFICISIGINCLIMCVMLRKIRSNTHRQRLNYF